MSLGFLTESALLPSKAKAIKVDSKSLVDLRAVVFQKEQERQERKRSLRDALLGDDNDGSVGSVAAGTRGFGRFAHLKATKKRGGSGSSEALSRDEEKTGKKSNRGVEKRRKQDEAVNEVELDEHDDDKAWHKKSRDMLAKKAKLYDDMMSGRASGSGSSSAAAVMECLVDFSAKKRLEMDTAATQTTSESVEITDEFGRVRFVAKDSAEHAEFLQLQTRKVADSKPSSFTSEHEADPRPECQATNGSFVVSQWEKRLNSQEKTYLQEVHEGVNQAKSAFLDKKSRKQLRLEKLQRQRDLNSGVAVAADQPSVSPFRSKADAQDEQAASMKATEFLNQLGSMM